MLYPLSLYGDACELFLSKTVENGWKSSIFQKWDGHNCIIHKQEKKKKRIRASISPHTQKQSIK